MASIRLTDSIYGDGGMLPAFDMMPAISRIPCRLQNRIPLVHAAQTEADGTVD